LVNATGFRAEAIAVAGGVPTGVARGLVGSGHRSQRIRSIDARALLELNITKLKNLANHLADTGPTHKALMELGDWCPSVEELAALLGTSQEVAHGLISGHLLHCERVVLWHCTALAQAIMRMRRFFSPADAPAVA